jgi:hypothetical protein
VKTRFQSLLFFFEFKQYRLQLGGDADLDRKSSGGKSSSSSSSTTAVVDLNRQARWSRLIGTVGTFHEVILHRQNTVQWMTASMMVHVTND